MIIMTLSVFGSPAASRGGVCCFTHILDVDFGLRFESECLNSVWDGVKKVRLSDLSCLWTVCQSPQKILLVSAKRGFIIFSMFDANTMCLTQSC